MTTPNIHDDEDKPYVWINEAKRQYIASVDPAASALKADKCAQRSLAASAIAHNMMLGRGRA